MDVRLTRNLVLAAVLVVLLAFACAVLYVREGRARSAEGKTAGVTVQTERQATKSVGKVHRSAERSSALADDIAAELADAAGEAAGDDAARLDAVWRDGIERLRADAAGQQGAEPGGAEGLLASGAPAAAE